MKRVIPRVYADTSVFGGVFDEEFSEHSRLFFTLVRLGRFRLVVSLLVADEIALAPVPVRNRYFALSYSADYAPISEDALRLHAAYLDAGVVPAAISADALHVATAVASHCDLLVSWNFRHIVNYGRIGLYNEVNAAEGFGHIAIRSPREVWDIS